MSDQIQELKPCYTYCRVSSRKQVTEGNGLSSQLQECKEYAKRHGFVILKSFQDEAISGGNRQREGLDLMLDECEQNPNLTVLFPSTSRLARDTIFLLSTVDTLLKDYKYDVQFFNLHGIDLKSDAGWLMLTMMGGQDEFMRKSIKTNTSIKRLARMQQGYYVDNAPYGYDNARANKDRLIVPNQKAPLVKEALEGFANGTYNGYEEVVRYLRTIGIYKRNDRVKDMLLVPTYAGCIHRPDLGIDMFDPKYDGKPNAKHEPIITMDTYLKILNKVQANTRGSYNSINTDIFYYNRVAKCNECNHYLSNHLIKKTLVSGKVLEFGYYGCVNRNCSQRSKTMNRFKIDEQVLNYLHTNQISPDFVKYIKEQISQTAKNKVAENKKEMVKIKNQNTKLAEENKLIITKIIATKSDEVMKMLENQVGENKNKLTENQKKLIDLEFNQNENLENVLNQCLKYASNLDKYFAGADNGKKKKLLPLLFPAGFTVQKCDDKIIVLNQQKSPLLKDFWGEYWNEFEDGSGGGDRTRDLRLMNPAL
jgi:site-specific DNA recombinase